MSNANRPLDATREANHSLREKDYMKSRMRKCHDCQTLTWDYRCPSCDAKWRSKHGVSSQINDAED